jgi:hypothetical protein
MLHARFMLLFLVAVASLANAEDHQTVRQISLVRSGGPPPEGIGDLSGTWVGTVRSGVQSNPLSLTLRFFKPSAALNGSMGPDPEHQLPVRNARIANGLVTFTTDLVSDVSLTLQEGNLTGEVRSIPDIRSKVRIPEETPGFDAIVGTLISTFDRADILALGESHRRKMDSDLRIRLVRHPDFARKVGLIVIEFGNTASQGILDRYISGADVPFSDLQQVWRNTSGGISSVWESPVYAEFLAVVREINAKLPANKKIRVLAGDPPAGHGDIRDRDLSPATILKEQVLSKHSKALLLYGSGHTDRVGGITKLVQASYPGLMFVVHIMGGPFPEYEKFETALKSSTRPVLVPLTRAPLRDLSAEEFFGRDSVLMLGGTQVPTYPLNITLGQLADACVYLGKAQEVETRVKPNADQ